MGLKFHFIPRYSEDGIKYVPLVDAEFTNFENGNRIKIQCRIDSGTDEIILPTEAGISC
jgi:hypothetical protein